MFKATSTIVVCYFFITMGCKILTNQMRFSIVQLLALIIANRRHRRRRKGAGERDAAASNVGKMFKKSHPLSGRNRFQVKIFANNGSSIGLPSNFISLSALCSWSF